MESLPKVNIIFCQESQVFPKTEVQPVSYQCLLGARKLDLFEVDVTYIIPRVNPVIVRAAASVFHKPGNLRHVNDAPQIIRSRADRAAAGQSA